MICSYGCKRQAKFKMSSGRWCCSKHYNSCPHKKELDRKAKQGRQKSETTKSRISKAKRGQEPWNKGKPLDQSVSKRKAKSIRKKLSEAARAAGCGGCLKDPDKEKKRRERISKAVTGKTGGYKPGCGRSRGQWHTSKIAGRVYLDSSYEVFYAEYLDDRKVIWKKNKIKFPYDWDGKTRYYIPDFYLEDSNEYIETKGFETDKDKAKWRDFPYKLTVLFGKDLKNLGFTGR